MDDSMTGASATDLAGKIVARAKEFGADLAGIARVAELRGSPSHLISEKMPHFAGTGTKDVEGRRPGQVDWPDGARIAVVLALAHPPEEPELDWWVLGGRSSAGNTAGNKVLMDVVERLAGWLREETGARCWKLPYHIEFGGIYMKDAAVSAGLGCIGKNNLLLTPEFGPRQRLRVLLADLDLPSTGPADFDPCRRCPMPCRVACQVQAFAAAIYTPEVFGIAQLPGRDGVYSRQACNIQMERDVAASEQVCLPGSDAWAKRTRFCRRCELACPVGRKRE